MDIERLNDTELKVRISENPDASSAQAWVDEVKEAIQPEDRMVYVDLTGLDVISSLGVNVIVGVYKQMERQHGTIKVIVSNERIHNVFELFRLTTVFEVEVRTSEEA